MFSAENEYLLFHQEQIVGRYS